MMINYYHVLGLTDDATPEQIKSAFKMLAVRYHPDKHPDRSEMEEKFKEINQAHQILSNPYEKARFDLQLKYRQFSSQPREPYTHTNRKSYKHPYRPFYGVKRMNSKQNVMATLYAFSFTFLIAALVMGGVWIKQSVDEKKRQKLLATRRIIFDEAKIAFDQGDFQEAYQAIASFEFFTTEEKDMRQFRDNMVDQIVERGHEELAMKNFDQAISMYNHAFELKPELSFLNVRKRLVEAYKQSGEIEKAITLLNEFLVEDFDIIPTLVNLAEIYRDHLNDNNESMENYQLAHRLAVKRYKKIYGEGYPILIKQEHLPISHYWLYTGLASMYQLMGNSDMAIKAANWNKYVWPDSTDAYTISALAYVDLGKRNEACLEFERAVDRGWIGEGLVFCN